MGHLKARPAKVAAAALVAAMLGGGTASAQQFTMKLSSPTINDSNHEWMKLFKAGVEARSKGKVKVEMYPANQLGQIPATVDGVALGTIEMTIPAIGFFIGIEPRFQTLETAGLFDSMAHGQKVFNDPDIRKRMATFGEAKGVEPLFTMLHGEMYIGAHKPIRSIADFKGMKLRSAGAAPLHVEPFKQVGASPISMPLGEVVPALQNKAIDGAMATYPVFVAFKYYDVIKYANRLPANFTIVSALVNRRFMKSLGPELEGIVRDEARKHEQLFSTFALTDHERVRGLWHKNGGETVNLPADDAKKYQAVVDGVISKVVAANPKMKEDYEALLAAARKYR